MRAVQGKSQRQEQFDDGGCLLPVSKVQRRDQYNEVTVTVIALPVLCSYQLVSVAGKVVAVRGPLGVSLLEGAVR